jgi:type I restriction enzyme M protein
MSNLNDAPALVNQIIAQATELLRGKVKVHDYHSISYLLLLQKEGIIKNTTRLLPENLYKDIIEKVALGEYEHKRIISDLLLIYQYAIREIDSATLYKLLKLIESIDKDFLERYIGKLIESVVYHVAEAEGRSGGEYIQPLELTSLICELSDLPEGASIYNPFAGVASFGVYLQNGVKYYGQEINNFTWATGIIRLFVSGKLAQSDYVAGNSITNWNPFGKTYNLIVANPPLGVRLQEDTVGMFGAIRTTEHFIIERGIQDLSADGKLIVVVPEGILFRSGADKELRRYLVEENLLDAVISLPTNLLVNTSVSVYLLIINKGKKEKGAVRFINAKESIDQNDKLDYSALNNLLNGADIVDEVRVIQNQTLSDSDYNLTVSRYFQKDVSGTQLGAVLHEIRGQRSDAFVVEKFVKISDLKDDKLDYYLIS